MQNQKVLAAIGSGAIIVALLAACLPDGPTSSQNPQDLLREGATRAAEMAPPTATAFVIEYVVSGDTTSGPHIVDVRLVSDGAEQSESDVDVSERVWSRFVTVKPGSELRLEATNHDATDQRPVRCEIYLSGRLWDAAESSNPGTEASCEAIAGW